MPASRPLAHLRLAAEAIPTAWKQFEYFRGLRGDSLPDWPAWCYAPISAGLAIVTEGAELHEIASRSLERQSAEAKQGVILTTLAAWRQTKGVYQFDEDLLQALLGTPITGDVPAQVLFRLPEWCVYVPLGRHTPLGFAHGFFAHLEAEVDDDEPVHAELRLLLDVDRKDGLIDLIPIAIDLGGPVEAGVISVLQDGLLRAGQQLVTAEQLDQAVDVQVELVQPLVSLILYLCSGKPDLSGKGQPGNPEPVRTKRGIRTFPAGSERLWNVGQRAGAALRSTAHTVSQGDGESGRSVRPHVRRAHWALRWTGPKTGEQTPIIRWIETTIVAARSDDAEELPAVIRPVKAEQD